jgi:SulP family sulfate permease
LEEINVRQRVLVIRMRHAHSLDATALHALEQVHAEAVAGGTTLILSGVHPQPRAVLERSGLAAKIGGANLCDNIDAALARASEMVKRSAG